MVGGFYFIDTFLKPHQQWEIKRFQIKTGVGFFD
jgi:hypothetical protein